MDNIDVVSLIKDYTSWYQKEVKVESINNHSIITTPFLDRNNDNVQIFVKIDGENIILSDDKWFIDNLEMQNISLVGKRLEILKKICFSNGVRIEQNELLMRTNRKSYPKDLHRFISNLLEVDDLYLTSQNRVKTLFYDDVVTYFEEKKIYYSESINFTGKTSFVHKYDFLFQKNESNPERLCKLINSLNRQSVITSIFMWDDTKENRPSDSLFIIIINDENKASESNISALENYGIRTILWSDVDEYASILR